MHDPTQADVDDLLVDIDEWNRQLNKQTVDHLNETLHDGTVVEGRVVKHGSYQYSVQASVDWPYVAIESSFDVAEGLTTSQAQARADGGQQATATQPDIQQAKQRLRSGANDDLDVIRREVIRSLSRGPLAFEARQDNDLLTGFKVERKVFPYDRQYSVQEYADDVQTVISGVFRGKEELIQRYDVRNAVGGRSSGGPRGFQ